MIKLLCANFHATIRSKRFWLGSAMMLATAIYAVIDVNHMKTIADFEGSPESAVFQYAILLFLILPALGSLFINTDYYDGTIRNKLTVGRSRATVYMANLITVYGVGLFYTLVNLAACLAVGIPLLGSFSQPQEVVVRLLMLALVFLSLSALFTLLATLIINRSVLLICVFMAFGLILGAQMVNSLLEEPEMIDEYNGVTMTTTEDGSVKMEYLDKNGNPIDPEDIPRVPNPRHVKEPMRTVLRTVNNIQPGGQLLEILEGGHPEPDGTVTQTSYGLLALYALGLSLVSTGIGIALFRKKDLK